MIAMIPKCQIQRIDTDSRIANAMRYLAVRGRVTQSELRAALNLTVSQAGVVLTNLSRSPYIDFIAHKDTYPATYELLSVNATCSSAKKRTKKQTKMPQKRLFKPGQDEKLLMGVFK